MDRKHGHRPRPPSRADLTRLTDQLAWLHATTGRSVYEVARRAAWNQYRNGQFFEAIATATKGVKRGTSKA